MNYSIEFYSTEIEEAILALPPILLARYFSLADRMIIFGANLGEPHTKAFGKGLFELRLKGSEGIARVFYCTLIGKRIVMLHSFVKKTQKTPCRELQIAQIRFKEVKNENL